MAFLNEIDILLFNFFAATLQTPTLVAYFGIICAKFLIYFIPLHLIILWLVGGRGERQTALAIVVAVAIGLICSFIIGHLFYRPRPFVAGIVKALIEHKENASFPSNHALIFTIYVVSLYCYRYRQAARVALVLALLTCWGRVFTGVHYPSDILGGIVVGLVVSMIVIRFLVPFFPKFIYQLPFSPKGRGTDLE
ncbi:undecaprenyl-diphosphatase [uncultured Bartonella sp.]|uniref:undecaprenyl-diphosphatase n=1 Tax=uncultured Bartonella sp. TaxID=104108 RepID=UPI0025EA4D15|nr:undecaprenyl-diphosphatase [uncultured Bartonella sp.]